MTKKKTGYLKKQKAFWGTSKWNLLYFILALLLLFSLFTVPKIAVNAMNETKGQIVTVSTE